MRDLLLRIHWLLSAQLGLDLVKLVQSIRGLPLYILDLIRFRMNYVGRFDVLPCLHDRYEEGGVTKNEYFWQDLLVARWIFASSPARHVDVGSRVDGFVAHVASFREIEVFDVRPITSQVPGVVFRQADFMNPDASRTELTRGGYCDSLSCLHAVEHFGLGRYGDPIDPLGFARGIENMARLLKPGGVFYLSTPIGIERVEFNANRVFSPNTIIHCAKLNGLILKNLTVVGNAKEPYEVHPTEEVFEALANCHYNLGIFVFNKIIE